MDRESDNSSLAEFIPTCFCVRIRAMTRKTASPTASPKRFRSRCFAFTSRWIRSYNLPDSSKFIVTWLWVCCKTAKGWTRASISSFVGSYLQTWIQDNLEIRCNCQNRKRKNKWLTFHHPLCSPPSQVTKHFLPQQESKNTSPAPKRAAAPSPCSRHYTSIGSNRNLRTRSRSS